MSLHGIRQKSKMRHSSISIPMSQEDPKAPMRLSLFPRVQNHKRTLFHVFSCLAACVLMASTDALTQWIAAQCAFVWAWSMEGGRTISPKWNQALMKVFAPVAHPHEYQTINSGTWYITALALLSWIPILFGTDPRKMGDLVHLNTVAVITLGVGDATAGYFGRKWGKTKIAGNKSLEGALFFVASSALASTSMGILVMGVDAKLAVGTACVGALAGAAAELWLQRWDDNLTIPIFAWMGGWVFYGFFGTT